VASLSAAIMYAYIAKLEFLLLNLIMFTKLAQLINNLYITINILIPKKYCNFSVSKDPKMLYAECLL